MAFVVLGISHKTATVSLRERMSFNQQEVREFLHLLKDGCEPITGAVVLSTCNRTEIYASATAPHLGKQAILDSLTSFKNLDAALASDLQTTLYFQQGQQCIQHLFKVVSSLDSLVLGEAQILGQVRGAFTLSTEEQTLSPELTQLFKQALETGKRVRNETAIGSKSVSISTAAVELAEQTLGSIQGASVLVVGAGTMAELLLVYLTERGATNITVANRTVETAQAAVSPYAGRAVGLDSLAQELAQADIVIASTGAQEYVITPALLTPGKERLLIDICMPRNIDPTCDQMQGVQVRNLDDLNATIEKNLQERMVEARKAEDIVHQEVDRFLLWLQESSVAPTIKQIYQKADGICQREVARAIKELEKKGVAVDDGTQEVLEALVNSISKKILHGPVTRMKKQAGNPEAFNYTDTARFLFGLDVNPSGTPCGNKLERCHLDRFTTCSLAAAGTCPFGRKAE